MSKHAAIVLATANPHKVLEVRALLAGSDLELIGLDAFPDLAEAPETGDTFEHNALQKARFVFEHTGLPCLADDSGLEVDALNGAPGVHSKRFSPEATHEANNLLLLQRLDGLANRGARFRCVLAYVDAHRQATVEGSCEGQIATELRGTDGFGYDPLFLPNEAPGLAMAELSMDQKNRISHRGRAFAHLDELLDR